MTQAKSAAEGDKRLNAGLQRHRLSLEVHRVAEYAIGLTLVALPFELGAPVTTVALGGAVVVVIGATTRGRLGLLQWCSPRVHRVLDLAAVLLLAVIPLIPRAGGGVLAVFLAPAAAVLALLMLRTDYEPPPDTARAGSSPKCRCANTQVEAGARSLGRLAGRLWIAAAASGREEAARDGTDPHAQGAEGFSGDA